ncbi:hypothetical protein [Laspinema olomoucense]|uniref:hypothetical protein n=1 Tax=Laspinema olomoucense TaxID=3231600 RepID=UPI0021BAA6E8|nr:hypothetical protein [Laspinema sp. D3a]MCT7990980.1 hypothetical protein [Laspinema sp. D3a]
MLTYQKFTIQSPLKPYQVREKLMGIVDTDYQIGEKSITPLYRGKIHQDSFQISKIIYHLSSDRYRESFFPVLDGQIREHNSGSQIDIQIKIHPGVMIFLGIWLITAGRATWVSLMMLKSPSFAVFLSSIAIFLAGLAIPMITFIVMAHHSKKFLINFLKE